MHRQLFLKLLAKEFYPVLRDEGFKGSGSTLRRMDGHLIHVFNVQGSKSGEQCYLNLGAHLSFLPAEGGLTVEPESLEESHCVFRCRIHPPSAAAASGWTYGNSVDEAARSIEQVAREWAVQGQAFFDRYASYPGSFVRLLKSVEPSRVHAREALHLARIATHLGQQEEAVSFARAGLASASERATLLRQDLIEILTGHGGLT
ncbi:DUF4304 domain-containing protein [Roseateles sp. P5_E7]